MQDTITINNNLPGEAQQELEALSGSLRNALSNLVTESVDILNTSNETPQISSKEELVKQLTAIDDMAEAIQSVQRIEKIIRQIESTQNPAFKEATVLPHDLLPTEPKTYGHIQCCVAEIGIKTYGELVSYTPKELEARLRMDEEWITKPEAIYPPEEMRERINGVQKELAEVGLYLRKEYKNSGFDTPL